MTESGGDVSRPEVEAAKTARETSRQRRGALGAAVAGFVLGAVVWHFVGFWSFLSGVVLHGPAAARRQPPPSGAVVSHDGAQAVKPPLATRFRRPASRGGSVGLANCSAASVDRSSGAVTVAACNRRAKRFAMQNAGRADRRAGSATTGARPAAATGAENGGSWIVQVDARSER